MNRRARWTGAAACCGLLGLLAGCAGWQTWPPVKGEPALASPNSSAALDVMEASLRWTLEKRPPLEYQGPIALNLPTGLSEQAYQGVARDVGMGAVPLSTKTSDLPIYHIVSFRIRMNEAEVELLRPALPAADYTDAMRVDPRAYEGYLLTLSGGLTGWTVKWYRQRSPGVVGMPELNFIDVPDAVIPEPEPEPAPETDSPPPADAAQQAQDTATGG
ncbi:MAG: hypothetical protein ACF8R7_06410 [Phycisphaerales bacterium JB039]